MTIYYTQAQIDEIGVFMANKLNESNQTLKDFFQEKIDSLAPVTPPAPTEPDAGGGTTPAPTAGMFLDDGREIKQKLLTVEYKQGDSYAVLPHGLTPSAIISVEANILSKNGYVIYPPNSLIESNRFVVTINQSFVRLGSSNQDIDLSGGTARVLITYLA